MHVHVHVHVFQNVYWSKWNWSKWPGYWNESVMDAIDTKPNRMYIQQLKRLMVKHADTGDCTGNEVIIWMLVLLRLSKVCGGWECFVYIHISHLNRSEIKQNTTDHTDRILNHFWNKKKKKSSILHTLVDLEQERCTDTMLVYRQNAIAIFVVPRGVPWIFLVSRPTAKSPWVLEI